MSSYSGMDLDKVRDRIAAEMHAEVGLDQGACSRLAGILWMAGFRPGDRKAVVRWQRRSQRGFEQNVVFGWAAKGVTLRAFARRETVNGVWRRQVTDPRAVAPPDVTRLLERTLFGFDDLEKREMVSGVGSTSASYPEMRGEDVYRYVLHGTSKEWLMDRYGVSAKSISNAARTTEDRIHEVGSSFKVLAGCEAANSKINEAYFCLGLLVERNRQERVRESRVNEELAGLSTATRSRCRRFGIETAEGLFGWLISGRLAREEYVGDKTIDEVVKWLDERGFPMKEWADINGAVLDARSLNEQETARQRSIAQEGVEELVRAATKLVMRMGLDRVIESREVGFADEGGLVMRGQLWVRRPEREPDYSNGGGGRVMGGDEMFSKMGLAHMHDAVMGGCNLSVSDEGLRRVFEKLPEDVRMTAMEWGLSDTPVRDAICEWARKNQAVVASCCEQQTG